MLNKHSCTIKYENRWNMKRERSIKKWYYCTYRTEAPSMSFTCVCMWFMWRLTDHVK